MGSDDDPIAVDGHTIWRAKRNNQPGAGQELATKTAINVDADALRWRVTPPGDRGRGKTVESTSPHVVRFMNYVIGAMEQVARSATHRATVQPIFKPMPPPPPPRPATAPVPCPLCNGEAWFDCELCDGDGVITARQAALWQHDHER